MSKKWVLFGFGLLILVQVLLHGPVFRQELTGFHVWRQTQTQNTILSFAEEDMNILNPRRNERGAGDGIFRMEFPLMQWMTAVAVRWFDPDVTISRIMTFIFSLFGWIGFFLWIKALTRNTTLSLLSAALFSFSPVQTYYMVNPMPDTLALSLAVWFLFFMQRWQTSHSAKDLWSALLMLMLAALVKLPYILYFGAFAWLVWFQTRVAIRKKLLWLTFGVLSSLPVVAWYLRVIPEWEGNGIVQGIFQMTPDQRDAFFYYVWFAIRTTLPELLVGLPLLPLFIWGSILILRHWKIKVKQGAWLIAAFFLQGLLLLFEMNMIETVHDYYFMPILPLLFLPVLLVMKRLRERKPGRKALAALLWVLLLAHPVYAWFRVEARWDQPGFNPDWLTYQTELRQVVPDHALVCAGNDVSHHIFLYYIDKKGWVFENNWINAPILEDMIEKGCLFLYSDSRHVDQDPAIRALFGTKIAEFGSVRVFELKHNALKP